MPTGRAAFLATIAVESWYFHTMEENLSYSQQVLLKLFPALFDLSNVNLYAHQPQKIANRIYGGKIGNGDEASGDGWKFHGRGFIQLTGRGNYVTYGTMLRCTLCPTITSLTDAPEQLLEPYNAMASAVVFWHSHANLNSLADADNMVAVTKVINGGYNSLDERLAIYNRVKPLLG